MKSDKQLTNNAKCAACGHIVTPQTGILRWFGDEEQLATRYDRAGYFVVHNDTTACLSEPPRHCTVFYFTPGYYHVAEEDAVGLRVEIANGGTPGGSARTTPLPEWVREDILKRYPGAVEVR